MVRYSSTRTPAKPAVGLCILTQRPTGGNPLTYLVFLRQECVNYECSACLVFRAVPPRWVDSSMSPFSDPLLKRSGLRGTPTPAASAPGAWGPPTWTP